MKSHFKRCMVLCALAVVVCSLSPLTVRADPPEAVVLSYDATTQTLTVNITHKSYFTGLHYIKQIEVKKNNQTVSANEYSSQPGKTAFTYSYNIPAANHDLLEVTASCNIYGRKTATLKIESKNN